MDGKIYWYESLILLFLYCDYIMVLIFNNRLKMLVYRWIRADVMESQFLLDNNLNQMTTYCRLDDDAVEILPISESAQTLEFSESNELPKSQVRKIDIGHYCLVPLKMLFLFTIPDCRIHRWRKMFPLSFLMSVLWLGVWCFILIWMVATIGYTLGIPDSVMGITFLAAGTSLPDALASIHAVKSGHASMGVSNTIGSNVFDLLVALAVPWLIQNFVSGTHVDVNSRGLRYNSVLLIVGLIFLVLTMRCRQFYLDRSLGLILISCYMVYVVLSLMIEMNVFGLVNLPMCPF
ncbi:hypothetical protein GJ496_007658 [Pomphorhynchus laevis]|nr:hypothetical protein GJ496_007658 [Pomphorhynchus laevis]